jgi:hypothetical protein
MAATSVTRRTGRWLVFDVVAGFILPLVCFALEPAVFSGSFTSLLGPYRTFVYAGFALATAALLAWLVQGPRLGRWLGLVAGMLLAASLAALLTGILLLPLSIIGLFAALLGLLGLVPFATAMAYLHNSLDAIHLASRRSGPWRARLWTATGVLLVVGAAGLVHVAVAGSIDAAVLAVSSGNAHALDNHRRWLPWCHTQCAEALRSAYHRETDAARRCHLDEAYRYLTGQDIRGWVSERSDCAP